MDALRSLSLKPISFGYETLPIRFSQADGQSAHKARPTKLELALTPLLKKYDDAAVDFMRFSDENGFSVEPPLNLQNYGVQALPARRNEKETHRNRRLPRTPSTFTKSVMVSIAVSKMGMTDLIFLC